MKNIISVIVTALLVWVISQYAWWAITVVPFLVAVFLKLKNGKGFLIGFASVALLWLYLIMKTDLANEHILSTRMADVFGLPHMVFLIVNIFLGGLIGGLGGWSGASMRKIFKNNN